MTDYQITATSVRTNKPLLGTAHGEIHAGDGITEHHAGRYRRCRRWEFACGWALNHAHHGETVAFERIEAELMVTAGVVHALPPEAEAWLP